MNDITHDFYNKAIRVFQREFRVVLSCSVTSMFRNDKNKMFYSIDIQGSPHGVCPWVDTRVEALLNVYIKIQNPGKQIITHRMSNKEKLSYLPCSNCNGHKGFWYDGVYQRIWNRCKQCVA